MTEHLACRAPRVLRLKRSRRGGLAAAAGKVFGPVQLVVGFVGGHTTCRHLSDAMEDGQVRMQRMVVEIVFNYEIYESMVVKYNVELGLPV